ncbi:MAG: protein translocase subunit SecD [Thiotrichales bacterium 34-46-19]|nr:MAG: protein translocase subunit SecD [Thiotrichales bacterium 35-46-9]OZA97102.1 MAG: protein translocase subunit SecD [Thiotrichales bacterium 34-46-19]OZB85903.1 MAG: protein translocase subunit SecD [Thiotrichales bacterium 12-47-6]HQT03870.1 protein translocase subunit SecD [Thiotrichales bacterium]
MLVQPNTRSVANIYPLWKAILVVLLCFIGFVYALPNIYPEDPAIQVSSVKGDPLAERELGSVQQALVSAGYEVKSVELDNGQVLVRFNDTETQLKAQDTLKSGLGRSFIVALNLAPSTPEWLSSIGGRPAPLGLDLRGGVHFLFDVDMDAAVAGYYQRHVTDLKRLLRNEQIRYQEVALENEIFTLQLREGQDVSFEKVRQLIEKNLPDLVLMDNEGVTSRWQFNKTAIAEFKKSTVQQNVTTLRNRVNELGVAEPLIQQQGERRIVVQLPGVQDSARAKEILGATATLEFRLVDEKGDVQAAIAGRVPAGSKLYGSRDGRQLLLKTDVIVTGDSVTDAKSGLDTQGGSPMVSVNLDEAGGRKMLETTKANVGNRMAVVFIESRVESKVVDGETIKTRVTTQDVINAAVIRDQFANRFQITGLDTVHEARNLALLLRAGALSAPMEIVEERTVGPSLGAENIEKGVWSIIVGFVAVLLFMLWRYKLLGLYANIALLANVFLIMALLSTMQATLTLPGIAGIVLTMGMAVDANVLINERIREELRNGHTTFAAIQAGFDKAFWTIADSHVTQLLTALLLFAFGSGPIKGFAITLTIGVITSMFTALMVSRLLVHWTYSNKKVSRVSV